MTGPHHPTSRSRPAGSHLHTAAIALGLAGTALAVFVSGYWAIGLGIVGAALAASPAKAGAHGAGRMHIPAFALCAIAMLLGIGAIDIGIMFRNGR